jgi:hypothetical protein
MLCDLPCVKYPTLPSNGINKTHATNSNGLWGIAGTCYRQLWIIHMGMVRWSITYPLCGWSSIVDSIMCRVCFMGIIHMVLIRWTQFLTHSKATCLCLFFLRYSYPRNCHLENSHRPWKSPVFSGNEWTWIFQPLAESMWMYVYVCMCAHHIIIRQTSDHVRLVQHCIASHHPKLCNWPLGAIGQREGRLFKLKRSKPTLA